VLLAQRKTTNAQLKPPAPPSTVRLLVFSRPALMQVAQRMLLLGKLSASQTGAQPTQISCSQLVLPPLINASVARPSAKNAMMPSMENTAVKMERLISVRLIFLAHSTKIPLLFATLIG